MWFPAKMFKSAAACLSTILVFLSFADCSGEPVINRASEDATFNCPINIPDCGEVHSVKFYRGTERIFVYSPLSDFKNAEGFLIDRGELTGSEESVDLTIPIIDLSDAGDYSCEIAFLDATTDCPAVHLFQMQVIAKPRFARLEVDGEEAAASNGPDFEDASHEGTYAIGTEVSLVCTGGEGMPAPDIKWEIDGEVVDGEVEEIEADDGRISTVNSYNLVVEREHLGKSVVCRMSSEAMDETPQIIFNLDVQVPPESLELSADENILAGTETSLLCTAVGANPPAEITWSADFELPEAEQQTEEEDGLTFKTVSTLTLVPGIDTNGASIACSVDHPALEERMEEIMELNVLYSPLVTTDVDNMTMVEGEEVNINCFVDANPVDDLAIVWSFNGAEMNESLVEANSPNVTFTADREMAGEYVCQVTNSQGTGQTDPVLLDVLYAVSVSLTISPEEPVIEASLENVTMTCTASDGNPAVMDAVNWFKDGELFETTSCEESECTLDVWVTSREMAGQFQCQGENFAGAGPISEPQDLIVYYLAGETRVASDEVAVRDGNITLECVLEEFGNPPAEEFLWKKNGEELEGETNTWLVLADLSAGSLGEYTCSAVNLAGNGPEGDGLYLEVNAPPRFLVTPSESLTVSEDDGLVNLTCRVECFPHCAIQWLRNDVIIADAFEDNISGNFSADTNSSLEMEGLENYAGMEQNEIVIEAETLFIEPEHSGLWEPGDLEDANATDLSGDLFIEDMIEVADFEGVYSIYTDVLEAEPELDYLASVQSVLSIDLSNASSEVLAEVSESNITCVGLSNDFGDSIYHTSEFFVEYGPRDLGHSAMSDLMTVPEGTVVEDILCTARGYPTPSLHWSKQTSDGEQSAVGSGPLVTFDEPINRGDTGVYTCVAENKRGEEAVQLTIDVQYEPECLISLAYEEDEIVLTCEADGNPQDYNFIWRRDNISFEGQSETSESSSVRLQIMNESLATYFCQARNSLGVGVECSYHVTNSTMYPAVLMDDRNSLLAVIVALAVVGFVILIMLIICWCAKKNKAPKGKEPPASTSAGPKRDPAFYEDLPFNSLKSPPKQVLNPKDDNMVYADVDSSDLYSYGPMGYKSASIQRANQKKKEAIESKV